MSLKAFASLFGIPLSSFLEDLDQLAAEAVAAFVSARVEFLGAKSGRMKAVQKQMGAVPAETKREAGMRFNAIKQQIQDAFQAAQARIESGAASSEVAEAFDISLPGRRVRLGRLHPITQTIEELKDLMARLGFSVAVGPEVEDEWHNFKALNIPDDHPARDPLENFYLATAEASGGGPMLLRSQTSTVQIRVMEKTPPPVRIISLGRVYRPDTPDATHYPMFHQMEGLLVDRGVTMAHLKSVLHLFAKSYLGAEAPTRFRPSFFPFTEPSVEVDFHWNGAWMEFGGAGMVDPNVLRAVGYNPDEVTGFAFGLGVERLCMRRFNITDIRELYKNDLRFLRQF